MWQGFRMTRSGLDAMPAPLRPLLQARIERLQQLQQQLAVPGEQLDEEELDDSGDEEPEQLTEVEEIVEDQDTETDDDTGETDDDDDDLEMEDEDTGEIPEVTKALTQQDLYLGIHFPADEFVTQIFPQLPEARLGNHEVRVYEFRSNDHANNFTDLMMGLRSSGNTFILGNKNNDPENWFSTNLSIPNRLSAGDRVHLQTDYEAPHLLLFMDHAHVLLDDPVPVPPLAPNGPYYLGWEIIKVLRRIDIEETFWIEQDRCPVHMRDPNLNQLEVDVRDLQHTPVVPSFMTVERVREYIVFNQDQWQARFVQRNNLEVGNTIGLYWDDAMECFIFARLAE